MRCKNCGSENDDNRYICENCGSPLYDENDNIEQLEQTSQEAPAGINRPDNDDENDKAVKKNAIVIAVLVVILIAVIVAILVAAKGKSNETTTQKESVTVSSTVKEDKTDKKETTTEEATTEESTTEESTTQTTTETTAKAKKTYTVNATTAVGGSVSGSGTYKEGDTVVLTATPDSGYEFSGWYTNGSLKSTSPTYQFNASENVNYTALFSPAADDINQGDGSYD